MQYFLILIAFTTADPSDRSRMGMGPFSTLEACEKYIADNKTQLKINLASHRGVTIVIEGCQEVPIDPS